MTPDELKRLERLELQVAYLASAMPYSEWWKCPHCGHAEIKYQSDWLEEFGRHVRECPHRQEINHDQNAVSEM